MATHTFGEQIHAPNEIAVDEYAVSGLKKIVKLLAKSPETKAGPILCGASGNMLYFSTFRSDSTDRVISKLIYKTKMPGTITAAVFHESRFEVYLKIEKKVHKEGKPVAEHEFLAFDLETKKHSIAESKQIPKEPWEFPAAPPQVTVFLIMAYSIAESRTQVCLCRLCLARRCADR